MEYFDLTLTKITTPYYLNKPYNLVGKAELLIKQKDYEDAQEVLNELEQYCLSHSVRHFDAQKHYFMAIINIHQQQIEATRDNILKSRDFSNNYGITYLPPKLDELDRQINAK